MATERVWIVGPSGSGKTFLLMNGPLKEKGWLRLDLDFVGYKHPSAGERQWRINREVFRMMADNGVRAGQPVALAGVDSEPDLMREEATRLRYKTLVLLPDSRILALRRKLRGDRMEKVQQAEDDFAGWHARAERWGVPTFSDTHSLLQILEV